jgi:hypothetical protein
MFSLICAPVSFHVLPHFLPRKKCSGRALSSPVDLHHPLLTANAQETDQLKPLPLHLLHWTSPVTDGLPLAFKHQRWSNPIASTTGFTRWKVWMHWTLMSHEVSSTIALVTSTHESPSLSSTILLLHAHSFLWEGSAVSIYKILDVCAHFGHRFPGVCCLIVSSAKEMKTLFPCSLMAISRSKD